jgi:hypothetical protein
MRRRRFYSAMVIVRQAKKCRKRRCFSVLEEREMAQSQICAIRLDMNMFLKGSTLP